MNNTNVILWAADALAQQAQSLAPVAEHCLNLCMGELRSLGASEEDIDRHLERLFTPSPKRNHIKFCGHLRAV